MKKKEILDLYNTFNDKKLFTEALKVTEKYHGKNVYLRGLIEFSNFCQQDCLYCGIRSSNKKVRRYRLNETEILSAVEKGFKMGLKTFVLQGGEDPYFSVIKLCRLVEQIKKITADSAAVTLSCGILSFAEFRSLKDAGTDRYLIRFETSDPKLHKYLRNGVTLAERLEALYILKDLNYQVGSGFMVGLPEENEEIRINNALLCRKLDVDMAGIGPFIPHHETPLKNAARHSLLYTLRATALLRLLVPEAHIPATTAAGSLLPDGREQMLNTGANVVMPNLTPQRVKKDYLLYPGKICLDEDGLKCLGCISNRIKTIGRNVSFDKADALRFEKGVKIL